MFKFQNLSTCPKRWREMWNLLKGLGLWKSQSSLHPKILRLSDSWTDCPINQESVSFNISSKKRYAPKLYKCFKKFIKDRMRGKSLLFVGDSINFFQSISSLLFRFRTPNSRPKFSKISWTQVFYKLLPRLFKMTTTMFYSSSLI